MDHVVQGGPGVDDVLDQVDVPVADVSGDVLHQHDRARGRRAGTVAGDLDEVDVHRLSQEAGQVGEKVHAALEHADEDRRAAGEVGLDFGGEPPQNRLDLLTGEHRGPEHLGVLSLSNSAPRSMLIANEADKRSPAE
jgi:hypothetical protein